MLCLVAESAKVRVRIRRKGRPGRVTGPPGDPRGRVRPRQVLREPAQQRTEGGLLRGRLGLPPVGRVPHLLRQLVHEHSVRSRGEGGGCSLQATWRRESLPHLI